MLKFHVTMYYITENEDRNPSVPKMAALEI